MNKRLGPFEENSIVCGDCLDVMRQMPDGCVDLVFADPPYNIGKNFGESCNDNRPDYWEWTRLWLEQVWRVIRLGGACYFKNHWRNIGRFDRSIRLLTRSNVRNLIVWQKGAGLASRRCYSMRWEAIWFVTKGGGHIFNLDDIRIPTETKDPRNNPNGKNPTDCWYIPRVAFGSKHRIGHPTQCPRALLERIIIASSNLGDLIFDPFMGSGTTAVVADGLGRRWFGCDNNPEYVAMDLERLEKDRLNRSQLELL